MDKEYFNILVFGHTPFGIKDVRIKKGTLKILVYLLAFFQLAVTLFLCDYLQVRKKTFSLNQLRQESEVQRSQIRLFSTKIEDLEKKLSELKEIDLRIRTMANLERSHEIISFIRMGGTSSVAAQERLNEETKGTE